MYPGSHWHTVAACGLAYQFASQKSGLLDLMVLANREDRAAGTVCQSSKGRPQGLNLMEILLEDPLYIVKDSLIPRLSCCM